MSKLVQCELREYTSGVESRVLVTWLDADKELKPGDSVKLKDVEGWWDVVSVGREHDRKDIKRGWGMTDYFGKAEDRK